MKKVRCPERKNCKLRWCNHRKIHDCLLYDCNIYFCYWMKDKDIFCVSIIDENEFKDDIKRILNI